MSDRNEKRALEIIAAMEPWFRDINKRRRPKDGRTEAEAAFDSGVFAASEFVRRLTRDETLAGLIHEVCCWRRKERLATAPPRARTEAAVQVLTTRPATGTAEGE